MEKRLLKKKIAAVLTAGVLFSGMSGVMAAPMDLSLQDSIDLAMNNNHTIEQYNQNAISANWALKEAKGLAGFNINWQGEAAKYSGETPDLKHIDKLYSNVVKASIPLYTGGRIENNIKVKKLGVELADLQLENIRQNVTYDVTSAYYQVLSSKNMVKVAQEAQSQIGDHLRVVKAMYDAGVVAKSDVLRSEVELANAQQQVVNTQNGLDISYMNLDNIMGIPVDSQLNLKDDLNEDKFPYTMPEVIDISRSNNLTLQQTNIQVEQAKAAINIAKSNSLPTIGGYAQYTIAGDTPFKKEANDEKQIGIQATWNIFDNNVTHSQVKQAEATYNSALAAQAAARESVDLAASQAYLSMEAAEKNIHTTAVAVTKAREDYKIAKLRYSAGVGTNLDVVDSRVALTSAENNYIKALYDFNVSKAQLRNVMGIGK